MTDSITFEVEATGTVLPPEESGCSDLCTCEEETYTLEDE